MKRLLILLFIILCFSVSGLSLSFTSGPEAIPVSEQASKLIWKTDIMADATVKISTSESGLLSSPTVLPTITEKDFSILPVDNLIPGTTIFYNVTVCANTTCISRSGNYTTLKIESVTVSSILAYNATINMIANMPVEGKLLYGTVLGRYDQNVSFSKNQPKVHRFFVLWDGKKDSLEIHHEN